MRTYVYLSLTPESLVASMLPPYDFGSYLAVGTQKRAHGQAMFFGIEGLTNNSFRMEDITQRCVPHPNGKPKRSLYLSIYRVLERVSLDCLRSLYLVTRDGKVLEIEQQEKIPEISRRYHLYQELCPVHPRIASTLNPKDFTRFITDRSNNIYVPKICFVDLRLGELAQNPETAKVRDLPYHAVEHLRDCLIQLKNNPEKHTKTVDRIHPQWFPYRTVETGVYVGNNERTLFYPFPTEEELKEKYYQWWDSASLMGDTYGTM